MDIKEFRKERQKKKQREYAQKNKEKIKIYFKGYMQKPENIEHKKEYDKIYFSNPKNKERSLLRAKKHYEKNKENISRRQKEYYEENKELMQKRCREEYYRNHDRKIAYQNQRRKKLKDFIYNYKEERGCERCGYNEYPEILEFHHNQGNKEFTISQRNSYSIKLIEIEIKKCIILCPNCHRVHHRKDKFGQKG